MSQTGLWLTIIGVSIGTFLLRLSFIELWKWMTVPPLLMRALNYVPAAVLAALVIPALVRSGGVIDLSTDNLRLYAGLAAAVVAWYSRSMLLTLAAGMAALWLLQAIASVDDQPGRLVMYSSSTMRNFRIPPRTLIRILCPLLALLIAPRGAASEDQFAGPPGQRLPA